MSLRLALASKRSALGLFTRRFSRRRRKLSLPVQRAVFESLELRQLLSVSYLVSSNADDGSAGTLRSAINEADTNHTSQNIITFAPALSGSTITLSSGLLDIASDITITGLGANNLTITPNNASQAFKVETSGTLDLSGVTVTRSANANGAGGALQNLGIANIESTVFSNNQATWGGAIDNEGAMTVNDTTFSGDSGIGGAIYNLSNLTVTNSTFTGNTAVNPTAVPQIIEGLNGGASVGGEFTITFGADTTGGILYSPDPATMAANIESALAALPNVNGSANISVAPFVFDGFGVTFHGTLAGAQQPLMTADSSGLTNESGPPPVVMIAYSGEGAGDLYNSGSATVSTSLLSGASSSVNGGSIVNDGTLLVSDSTVTAASGATGGALYTDGALATVINSTFWANSASGAGGAIAVVGMGQLVTTNATISDNKAAAGGGLAVGAGPAAANLYNTIVAGNTLLNGSTPSDVSGSLDANNPAKGSEYNLFGTGGDGNPTGTNNVVSATPGLGTLASNGGPTPTVAISASGPAFNGGNPADAVDINGQPLITDQRGFFRNVGGRVDIGAYEANSVQPATPLQVNTIQDFVALQAGTLTLRQAIGIADFDDGGQTITFASSVFPSNAFTTITLTNPLEVDNAAGNVVVQGPVTSSPAVSLTVSGANEIMDVYQNATGTLNNLEITGGNNMGNGGGVNNAGTLTVNDSLFLGNTGDDGGGIYNQGHLFVNGTTFTGNDAQFGAGIYNNGTIDVNGSSFIGGTAGDGGAILNNGVGTVTSVVISGNGATFANGGGVDNNGILTIANAQFTGNNAEGGGAINNNSLLTLNNVTLSGDGAMDGGGGIYNNGDVTANNVVLTGESSTGGGGGLYNEGDFTLTGGAFIGDSTTGGFGGAVFALGGDVSFTDVSFVGNSSDTGGGAITSFAQTVVEDSTFNGNFTTTGSGADGGAIYNDGSMTIVNSTLYNNTADGAAGAIYDDIGLLSATNDTIVGNSAASAGGIFTSGNGNVSLYNTIVGSNTFTADGGGYSNVLGQLDTELFPDQPPSSNNLFGTGDGINGNPTGPNNITVPDTQLLLSSPGIYTNNPFNLNVFVPLPGSQAIDNGDSSLAIDANNEPLTLDERGEPRIVGSNVDIGAVEAGGFSLTADSPTIQSVSTNSNFSMTVTVTPAYAQDPVDGGLVNYTFVPGTPGASASFSPSATISGGAAPVTATANGDTGSYTAISSVATGGTNTVAFTITNTNTVVATQLDFIQQPTNTTAGQFIAPAVTVAVEDSSGHIITTDDSLVTISLNSGPFATLNGTLSAMAVNGVATFSTLSINTDGNYTLAAADASLPHAVSDPFSITSSAADQLAFTQEPSNTVAGQTITPAVTVAVEDQFGNIVTTDDSNVTVAIATGPTNTLNGTLMLAAVNGVATFSTLSIDTVGAYTLDATDSSLLQVNSTSFEITAAAANHLAFIQEPSNTVAGQTIAPVTVAVEDQFNNVVATDSSTVTVAIATGPSSVLNGTLALAAVNGVATFSTLSINTVGAYTLDATDAALAQANSTSFNITAAAANHLAFIQEPTNTIAGQTITPAVTVAVEDQFNNIVTTDGSSITIAIATGPTNSLNGILIVPANSGVATFSTLSINIVGAYTLDATDASFTQANSSTFNITAAAANHLAFIQEPTNTTAGQTIVPVTVAVEDQFNNVVASDNSTVTVSIASGPSSMLNGTLSLAAVNGVATFSTLSINTTGTYELGAADGALAPTDSTPFNITAAAANHLAFIQEPTDTIAGQTIAPVTVAVEDQFNNVVTGDSSTVTVAIATGPSSALNGTLALAAVNGVATFSTLSINTVGSYELGATDASLAPATSTPFNITPAASNHLAFIQDPTNTVAGQTLTPAVTVAVEDQFNNIVTGDNSSVTLALASGPADGVLNGALTEPTLDGVATFSDLSINQTGTYTLGAADAALHPATSTPFNITPAAADQLDFVQQPTDTVAGQTITPAVTVAVEDRFGNVVTSDNSTVDLAINTGPAGSVLNGAVASPAVSGIATFSTLSINTAGAYALRASDLALVNAVSNPFNITPAAANHLAFIQQPTTTVTGQPITPAVTLAVEDQFNNIETTDNSSVTIAVNTGPAGAVLGGTLVEPTSGGIATFNNLTLTPAGPYTLLATDPEARQAVSDSFDVTQNQTAQPEVDLSVTKSVNNSTPNVGADVIYLVTLTNTAGTGIVTGTDISVSDALPAGESLISSTPSTGSYSAGVWSVPSLAAGATATLSYTVQVNTFAPQTNTAAVTAADQTEIGTQLSASVTVNPEEVDLSVTKTVNNSTPNVGANVTYTITVSNAGGFSTATNVSLSDMLPSGETLVSATPSVGTYSSGVWSIPSLAAGASATLTDIVTVKQFSAQTNTATITAADQTDIGSPLSASVSINPQEVDLSVTKTVNNATPNVGANVTYTVTVSNASGFSTATHISLSDMLPSGETLVSATPSVGTYSSGVWSIPSLAAGASATLTDIVTVKQFAAQTNTATITAADQTDIGAPLSASVTINPQEVDLSVTKTVNNSTPNVQSNVIYTVTVSNASGFSTATNISLSDILPSGESLVSATPSTGTYSGGVWSIPSLAAGSSATLTYTATVTKFAPQTNTATISSANQTDIGTQLSASVTVNPQEIELSVAKTVNNAAPNVGTNVTYTITVSNANGFSTATNISLADALPSGESLVSATPSVGTYSGGAWSIPTLAAGGTATLTYVAKVNTFAAQTNTATVTSATQYDVGSPLSASVTINPQEIDLSVTKTVSNSAPNVGTNVTYTVTVSNASGFSTATNISLCDVLPSGESLVSATPSTGTYTSGVWSIPTLAAGGTATLTYTAKVNQFCQQTNTAAITSASQTDIGSPLSASVTINPQEIDLSITKTANNSTPSVGSNEVYTVTVKNAAGYTTATHVSVTDLLPSTETFVSATASEGTYSSGAGVWSVGSIPAGGSATLTVTATMTAAAAMVPSVTNTATITAADQTDIGSPLSASATVSVQGNIDLSILKTESTPQICSGSNVTYTVTVTNASGYANASGISVTDILPSGLSFVSTTPSQGSYSTSAGVWNVGSLAGGDSATLTVVAKTTCYGVFINTASITCATQHDVGTQLSSSVTLIVGAAVNGEVWNDSNGNGLIDTGEAGLSGVTVELLSSHGNVVLTTTTNSSGDYSFLGVAPGNYTIEFFAPTGYDFTAEGVGNNSAINSSANPDGNCNNNNDNYNCNNNNGYNNFSYSYCGQSYSGCYSNSGYCGSGFSYNNCGGGSYSYEYCDNNSNQCYNNSGCNNDNIGTACVTLVCGTTTGNINAGMYLPGSIGNFVWLDSNGNGLQDAGEQGINDVLVKLLSTSGQTLQSTYTSCSGQYDFTNLAPGQYVVQFFTPCGFMFTTEGVGNNPALNSDANPSTGKTSVIALTSGETDNNVDAGMFESASLCGTVYIDYCNNGQINCNDAGLSGITIQLLSGSGQVVQSTTTDCNGNYCFSNVAPGAYSLLEPQTQMALNGYLVGKDTPGAVGCSTDGSVTTAGLIGNIQLASGADGDGYNFGESAQGQTLTTGDCGSVAFWASQAGQNLLCALNGSANANLLGNYLASNFSNIYGKNAGSNCLTNKTNSQVVSYFLNLNKNSSTQLNAQVLACAFNLYVTNSSLAGNVAANYGFTVTAYGCGVAEFNTWIYGSVCGCNNNTLKTVMQVFQYCNVKASNGQLYGGNSSAQSQADALFTAINQAGDIGADC